MVMHKKGWAFRVYPGEAEKIIVWQEKHIKEKHNGKSYAGAISGRFSYEFTPTSLGDIAVVKCSCGAEFCFRDI